jgi:hypothetical protein
VYKHVNNITSLSAQRSTFNAQQQQQQQQQQQLEQQGLETQMLSSPRYFFLLFSLYFTTVTIIYN